MPTHQGLGIDNRDDLQDQREPSIQLDKEPPIVVGKQYPAWLVTPQDIQLMSERHVLRLEPALRLEWQGNKAQDEAEQRNHRMPTVGDSFS
jgi:hypothetical protein